MPQFTMKFPAAMGRIVSVLLCCVLLLLPVPPAQAVKTDSLIRVGLFYGSSTLPTANLANEVGSGYAFGFYDSANTFISLGRTDQEKITICKDRNLYVSGGSYYETPTVGD